MRWRFNRTLRNDWRLSWRVQRDGLLVIRISFKLAVVDGHALLEEIEDRNGRGSRRRRTILERIVDDAFRVLLRKVVWDSSLGKGWRSGDLRDGVLSLLEWRLRRCRILTSVNRTIVFRLTEFSGYSRGHSCRSN